MDSPTFDQYLATWPTRENWHRKSLPSFTLITPPQLTERAPEARYDCLSAGSDIGRLAAFDTAEPEPERLCIPRVMVRDMLILAHTT
jgi:hypothetical protein